MSLPDWILVKHGIFPIGEEDDDDAAWIRWIKSRISANRMRVRRKNSQCQ